MYIESFYWYQLYCIYLHSESPHRPNITLIATIRLEEPDINIYLHWSVAESDDNSDSEDTVVTVELNTSYSISIFPELVGSNQSNFTISNTSILLTLFYDQDYNISVVARNCVGASEPAELYVMWDG